MKDDAGAALAPADWERGLSADLSRPVRVHYGRARRSVVRAAEENGVLVVRLNAMFADAPPEVRSSMTSWLRSGKRAPRACRILDDWIDERLARLHAEQPTKVKLRTRGACHDLERLMDEVVRTYFASELEGELRPRITWGRATKSRSRHTLRLGSYDHGQRLVRIHTVLDQVAVPEWFVRYVVFHECLHAVVDGAAEGLEVSAAQRRRRRHHGKEFRAREAEYPGLGRVLAWEREHIRSMIRSARSGRAMRTPLAVSTIRAGRAAARTAKAGKNWVQRVLF